MITDRVTADTLNDVMPLDHVIRVHEDGTVSHPRGEYAPELVNVLDAEGYSLPDSDAELHRQARADGWELETGWTGQYGYNGPGMHESEYVGGYLADHILAAPGLWVAVPIIDLGHDDETSSITSWALAHRAE